MSQFSLDVTNAGVCTPSQRVHRRPPIDRKVDGERFAEARLDDLLKGIRRSAMRMVGLEVSFLPSSDKKVDTVLFHAFYRALS